MHWSKWFRRNHSNNGRGLLEYSRVAMVIKQGGGSEKAIFKFLFQFESLKRDFWSHRQLVQMELKLQFKAKQLMDREGTRWLKKGTCRYPY